MSADNGKGVTIPAVRTRVSQLASCEKFERKVFSVSEFRELRKLKCANKKKAAQHTRQRTIYVICQQFSNQFHFLLY